MRTAIVLLLAASMDLATLWNRVTRDTNSHASAARGVAQYTNKQDAAAAQSFARAHAIHPDPVNAFNLGTAQVAAGKREDGSATLGQAIKDARLRPDALYNRGTSALASNAFDHAIRDYQETLRLRPSDMQAKRNLEIAMLKRQQQRRAQSGGKGQPQPQNEQRPAQNQQKKAEGRGEMDAESLLRSVQEQEREELQRMKRARSSSRRIGW